MHNVRPMELNSNSMKYTPTKDNLLLVKFRRQRSYNIVLIVALVISLLAVAVLIGLHVTKEKPLHPGVCETMKCASVAATVYSSMDMTVDPCADFYQYSCGSWLKNTPIPDSRSRYHRFAELTDKNTLIIKHSLQDIVSGKKKAENNVVQNAANYYKACMDKKGIQDRGDAPLRKMIADYGSWPITDEKFNESLWDFDTVFTRIPKDLGLSPLFKMYVGEDLKNSTRNSITFDQPSFQLSRQSYLGNTSEYNIKVRTAYRVYMKKIVKLLGANESSLSMMDDMFEFERSLSEKSLSVNERRDYQKIYSAMTLKQFANETGIELTWLLKYLNNLFDSTSPLLTENERIVSFATAYIRDAYKMLKAQSIRLQATYMMWPAVKMMAETLLGDYQEVINEYRETISGTTEVDPRWQTCISSTMGSYNFALSGLFVKKTFTKEAKQAAEEMITGVRSVFVENLKNLNWMDQATKKAAEEKAIGIIENIGYPDFILNRTALQVRFKGLVSTSDNYFENILIRRKYYKKKALEKRGKPVDKNDWKMYPTAVNAYYSPPENKIVFPAGILQPPFYDLKAPRALNYGAIGMVVGHEITHGFDDQGRQFDKNGNVRSWWSNSSVTNFKQKTKCLVDQYSKFSLFNRTLNGNQTLGENIADNGGIKASLQAYRNYVAKNGEEKLLPGLGLTSEQLYYVGFAQIWCSAYRESAAINQIDSGYHSLSMYRVTGSVQNSEDFSKAFNCKKGSPMNPEKKCTLW